MSELQDFISKENTYIFQAFFVIFLALIADLIQKFVFKRLAKKAEREVFLLDKSFLQVSIELLKTSFWPVI